MLSKFRHSIQPILLEIKNNKFQAFLISVNLSCLTGATIGSGIGLYNGFTLSIKQKEATVADRIKITLGGWFDGITQGTVYGCYPIYPLYMMLHFMGEYNRAKRINDYPIKIDY